jgi:hypothetical protein
MDLFIAITSYENKIYSKCAQSLLDDIRHLERQGHQVATYFHNGDCYIERARNYCVEIFLHTHCTDLIFIDNDLGWDLGSMQKLLVQGKEIVAGVYPYRSDNPDTILDGVPFPVTLKFDSVTGNCLDPVTGLVSVNRCPTGFMRINRSVFEKMIDKQVVRRDDKGLWNFFNTGFLNDNDNVWYGEDVSFLKKWRDVGGEIWIVPDIYFKHIGIKEYSGNYHNYLVKQGM